MEVTRYNFHERLDDIIADINESSFIAVDTEFTGLDVPGFGHPAPLDTPAERYFKLRNGASEFLILQFGLCTFKEDTEKKRYEAKPYNFYIFPRPANRQAPDKRFMVQSSSIDFLCSQGFDFNKVFKEGISYLTPDQEARLRKDLEYKHSEATKLLSPGGVTPDNKKSHMPVPAEQQAFVDGICAEVEEYLQSDLQEPLSLAPCNAFQRKLIYQSIETKFPLTHLETKTGEKKERYIVVHRTMDNEERLKKQMNKQATELMELDIQFGFTKVIQAITKSGKLVIGHNMMLDVIHCLHQFQCQLPEDLEDFKTVVKSVFPRLLDTKLMASTHPFKEYITMTSLEELKQTLQQSPFKPVQIDLTEGFERYKDGAEFLHEAGFDAYVTGSCFAHMTRFLGTFQNPPDNFLSPTSHVVEPFVNKLFLMRIQDIPYLNLNGPDLNPPRPHVFHVTFPKEWKASDIHSLFQPYGNVQISWLSETTVFVSLYKKDNAEIAQKALLSQDVSTDYHVVSYDFHMKNRALHRSSPNITLTRTAEQKRKQTETDIEFPSPLVKRQKVAHEVSPGPTIPENEAVIASSEQKSVDDFATPKSHKGQMKETAAGDSKDGASSQNKAASADSKLFEECQSW